MHLLKLVFREISFRRVNFGISCGVMAVVLSSILIAAFILIRTQVESSRLTAEKRNATESMMKEMVEEYRNITARMAYTMRVIPKEQDVLNFHTDGFASHNLPDHIIEEIRTRFRENLRFALPVLRKKVVFERIGRSVLVTGMGEPVENKDEYRGQGGIPCPVEGTVSLGFELHQALDLRPGDSFAIKGKEFTVAACETQRGSIDDITVWLTLNDAANVLRSPNAVNEIWIWPSLDITYEDESLYSVLGAKLTNVKVLESSAPALMQIRARMTAANTAKQAVERENKTQKKILARELRSIILIGSLILTALVFWVSMLMSQNVNERRAEFAALRTLGYQRSHIAFLVMVRSFSVGLAGIVLGTFAGIIGIVLLKSSPLIPFSQILSLFAGGIVGVVVITLLSAIAPLQNALGTSPAAVLAVENE